MQKLTFSAYWYVSCVWSLSEEEFQTMQRDFLEKYYTEFEDTEENKFIYTDIHKEYVSI